MFTYQTCAAVPEQGGRGYYGGGVVEVEGRVAWGVGVGGVYRLDEDLFKGLINYNYTTLSYFRNPSLCLRGSRV